MRSWRTQGRSRERILCFGVQGTGKSHAALTIMQRCPADTFFVIDNDNAWDRQIEGTELEDMVREEYRGSETKTVKGEEVTTLLRDNEYENPDGNIIIYHCEGWDENVAAIKDAFNRCGRHDWIVIDNVTMLWDDVQKKFIQQIFGSEVDKYFLEVRLEKERNKGKTDKDAKSLGVLEGWMDWPVINAMWKQNVASKILNPPGHLFMMAEIDTIGKEADSEVKGLFGPYGVKPKGQKRTGHNPQTVMLMTVTRQGDWKMTTIKDRGQREKLEQEPVEEFAKDYLFKIGGWRATDVEMEEAK